MRKLMLVLVLAACGGDGPTEPTNSLTGKWTASRIDVFSNVTFNLVESGDVAGSWTGTLIPNHGWAGTVTGARNGESFTLRMVPFNLPCDRGYVIEAERNGSSATGTATVQDCDGKKRGASYPVTLSR